MLSPATLARLRATYAKHLPKTCAVHREEPASNGGGGFTKVIRTVEAALRANAVPKREPLFVPDEAGRPVVVADYNVYLGDPVREPDALDVRTGDVIMLGRVVAPDGVTVLVPGVPYRVVTTDKGRGENVGLTVTAKQVQ